MLSIALLGCGCGVRVKDVDQQVAMFEANHIGYGTFWLLFNKSNWSNLHAMRAGLSDLHYCAILLKVMVACANEV